jgi:hypothetical protein
MGYFANGTENMMYEERYCAKCIHDGEESGCAVMLAHMLFNYEECNNPESILHLLIPRSDDGLGNERCRMFADKVRFQDKLS